MSFNALLVPALPFENFKWQWACLQCTEGLNDPVVLLGVLFRMRKLELLNRSIAIGLTMRMDIHQLFDSGHLRIHANGTVFLTDRARMDYGALIPPLIHLPPMVNPDFVRWRWENYNGL